MPKPRLRWTLLLAGVMQGIGMLVEAFQIFRDGAPIDLESRPWVRLVERVGLSPEPFGPIFLVMGTAWLALTIAILRGTRAAHRPARILAIGSLWYIIAGTGLALIFLLALATFRERPEAEG